MQPGSNVRPVAGGSSPGFGANAPSVLLPLRFMLLGMLALAAGIAGLVARPDLLASYHYNQHIIALTHLLVLGWILTIVMGATYQLVPVALETRLYSERLAKWQFLLHAAGSLGMIAMFWKWNMEAVGHFGSILAAGLVLYAYNIARTLMRVPRWTIVATAVASSLVWLGVAATAGLVIVTGKCIYSDGGELAGATGAGSLLSALKAVARLARKFDQIGAMHAHAHLGAVGVFVMLIMGISYRLLPMFALSEPQSRFRANLSVALLNLGLAASFVTILIRSPLKFVAALVAVGGVLCYGLELRAILQARKRRTIDWGLRYFLTATALLAPTGVLALVLAWPRLPLTPLTGQLENLYGFLGLVGVVSFAILGMLYKILPFLVWFHSYSAQVGLAKVPSLGDLYSVGLQRAGYWTYLAGIVVVSAGIVSTQKLLVFGGSVILGLSVGISAVNAIKILSHLIRPRTQPLSSRAAAMSGPAGALPLTSL